MSDVTIDSIRAAQATIAGSVRQTPMWPSVTLSEMTGVPVSFKCEQLQRTGAFKLRGATNFIASLTAEERRRGLVAASAGNHAQGVACAAQREGIDVIVVMPAGAPLTKVTATEGYGARVILHGASLRETRDEAVRLAKAEDRIYVPPFDDDRIIAGQGTVGLEILEQAPDAEEIVVPAGGGGLLAGIAMAVKALRPGVRVVGVQPRAMDGIRRSLAEGRVIETGAARTIADGTAVAGPSPRTFRLIERYVDDVVTVHEDAIAQAILLLIERSRMVVEGAGALGVAAALEGSWRPAGPAVVVLSGGNIDINLVGAVVRRGLVNAGRYQHLALRISDRPGQLAQIARTIADQGGNIIDVNHDRDARGIALGEALLDLVVEVQGEEHFARMVQELADQGFEPATLPLPPEQH